MDLSQDLIKLHDEVSRRVKEYEHRTGLCPPPEVLNELRYALRGVIELHSSSQNPDQAEEHIRHALRCAYHDLVDGILIELSRQMDIARQKYPEATIRVLGDRRLRILELINGVEDKVAASRQDRSKRADVYEEIYDDFPKLADELKFFDQIALPDIIAEADRVDSIEANANRMLKWGIGLTAIGVILTMVSIL